MEHPYKEFENLVLWGVFNKAIADLEENQDLLLKTPREYVIGYLCKSLVEGYSVNDDLDPSTQAP